MRGIIAALWGWIQRVFNIVIWPRPKKTPREIWDRERFTREAQAHEHRARALKAEMGRSHPDVLRYERSAKQLRRMAKQMRPAPKEMTDA